MSKLIKVYGERNTNTNYVSKLLELNLNVNEVPGTVPISIRRIFDRVHYSEWIRDFYFRLSFATNLGWKHSLVKPWSEIEQYRITKSNLFFLTITKNPYSWLLSLYRNPYHQYYSKKPSFETFVGSPWKTVRRDNIRKVLSSPVELWNMKNKSYLQLDSRRALNITTESIFEDPQKCIKKISKKFSIEAKSEHFIEYARSTKEVTKDSNYYRDFYLSERWRHDLSDEAIEAINKSVDQDLMAHFGYRVLPCAERHCSIHS
ncbi:MAG: hypothetical protein VXX82_06625 [Verrucomicrobiota bacterium]|nr:hypothetical protein [Verrucomicrobiota bacterium]